MLDIEISMLLRPGAIFYTHLLETVCKRNKKQQSKVFMNSIQISSLKAIFCEKQTDSDLYNCLIIVFQKST